MKKLIHLALALIILIAWQLPTTAAPGRKHSAKAAEGPRSILKTTGAQMDAPYVARGTHWENYNFGDNSPNRLSIVDESCPHEKLTEFGFGSVSSANNEWDFRIRWTPRSGEQVDAFKVTMVLYDEFHSKLDTVTFTVPEEIETIAATNDGHHHNIKTGYGLFSYNGVRAGGGPLGLGRPITTHIIDVKAYISAASLSNGTVWEADDATKKWAETLGSETAAAPPDDDCPLKRYTSGTNFIGNPIWADTDFFSSLDAINTAAKEADVKIYITSSFRLAGHVSGAVVTPAKQSNHMVGHAIDMKVQYVDSNGVTQMAEGPGRNNVLSQSPLPAPVDDFIQRVKKAGLRWGGDFKGAGSRDVVHIDDGYNKNKAQWIKKYIQMQRCAKEAGFTQ